MKPEALVTRGHAVYTPLSLRGYDLLVHGFNNHALWACPTRVLEAWVQQHLSARHLDVGVGTGLLLDRATFPSPSPELVLADLSAGSLGHCAARLARYHPRTVRANVLEPLPLPDGAFDSIGGMYLLHCLPAGLPGGKWVALDHLGRLLAPGGVLFGATLLGEGRPGSWAARWFMGFYNRKGIFDNLQDSPARLEEALRARFTTVEVQYRGLVGLFAARGHRG